MIKGNGFTIENQYENIASIYPVFSDKEYTGFDANYLVLDFGRKTKNDLLEISFLFKSDNLEINSTSASCGCTHPTFKKVEKGIYIVHVEFTKSNLTENVSKVFSLHLNNNKSLKFNLIINKT